MHNKLTDGASQAYGIGAPAAAMCASQLVVPSVICLKRFCDTFTGAVKRAIRCDSFVGESFTLLVIGYGRTRWTPKFTWFRPSEHSTLRPWEN
jgi:hypothetical protein